MNDRMTPDRDDVIARLEAVAEYHERRARELSALDAAQTTEAMANEQEGMSVLADAARDALTLLRETWRPISEAPRDGTAFLGYSAKYGWCSTCRYDRPDDDLPEIGNPQWEFMQPVRLDGWLPLPPLPKEEG